MGGVIRILIAEDDAVSRLLLVRTLEIWDYEVVTCKDGAEAWEQLQRNEDLTMCVLDWHMPRMDGMEVVRRARELGRLVYTIMLTARSDIEEMAFALHNGASDYMLKPFNPIELRARLRAGWQVTELHRSLSRASRFEAIGKLADGMAHEINTPIQYIGDNVRFLGEALESHQQVLSSYRLFAQAMRRGEDPAAYLPMLEAAEQNADLDFLAEETPQAVDEAVGGLERVSSLIHTLQDFAKPTDHQLRLADLNKAIRDVVAVAGNTWRPVADLDLELDASLPLVHCVQSEIQQVLLALVGNSCDAIKLSRHSNTSRGTIRILSRQERGQVVLEVIDSAPRPDAVTPTFPGLLAGVGTGLVGAYKTIIDVHRGELTCQSTQAGGTSYRIALPVESSLAAHVH